MENKNLNNNAAIKNEEIKTKTLVIDLGNSNIKVTDGIKEEIYPSTYSKEAEKFPEKLRYIYMNDEYVFFEKGDYSLSYDKTKKDFVSAIAYAISKVVEEEICNVNLVLLLPIDQMKNQNEYINNLENKDFQFTVRTDRVMEKLISVNRVIVCPEGFSSWWSCTEEERKKYILIVDIGGRTTNIIGMKSGESAILDTFEIGILNLFERLKNKSGKNYPLADVEYHINNGDIVLTIKYMSEFLMEIIDQMYVKRYYFDNFDEVIFTGGGSKFLQKAINKLPSNCRLHENPLKSNIVGAMVLGKQVLGIN